MAKILVVDDSQTVREMIRARLEANGFDVITAADGQEAISKTTGLAPDLIIMDIVMPVMDGYTALRELRKNTETRSIPVIMFTVIEEEYMRDLLVFEKISGFIEKDAGNEELLNKVSEALKSRKDNK